MTRSSGSPAFRGVKVCRSVAYLLVWILCAGCTNPFGLDEPDGLWISATAIHLRAGDSLRLQVTLRRDGEIYELPRIRAAAWPSTIPVHFMSSEPAVVTVSDNGWLVARGAGRAVLSLSAAGLHDTAGVAVLEIGDVGESPAKVSAGGSHSCGLTDAGVAYCWGSSWFGEIGTGTRRPFTATVSPVSVATRLKFTTISAGQRHACALDTSGAAWCWGENIYGQIGDGTVDLRARPTRVRTETVFSALTAGSDFTCAVTTAGVAYCWGQLPGAGSKTPRRVDAEVRFSQVVAGGEHACGLTLSGALYCWGANNFGQLGTESSNTVRALPVLGGHEFASVNAGQLHTCAIDREASAYCWGSFMSEVLGTGQRTRTPLPVRGGLKFAHISAGGTHTCGLTLEGAAYCWGGNFSGQLGVGFSEERGARVVEPAPVRVLGGLRFRAVSAGLGEHSCGVTIDSRTFCWGLNLSGQLGYGGQDNRGLELRGSPVPVVIAF